jgi:hypothetical protein
MWLIKNGPKPSLIFKIEIELKVLGNNQNYYFHLCVKPKLKQLVNQLKPRVLDESKKMFNISYKVENLYINIMIYNLVT